MKLSFVSMLYHRMGGSVTSLKEGVDIVRDELVGPLTDKQRDCLDLAHRGAEELTDLINDAFCLQNLDEGKTVFHIESVNINNMIEQIREVMIDKAVGKGLNIKLNLDNNITEVKADRLKIDRVINDILENAIYFTDQGEIEIVTKSCSSDIQASIKDSGVGIKEDDIKRLFVPFQRLGDQPKTDGATLSLAICEKIILAHHGKIWVESEPSKGTTFYFTLPK
ncbi:MAG: HAMP domain-containing histidine kinase [Candidatus Omnitrophica bacterium]|nr:HAMP domain-containing histidine kinase [Candidatus Omnitrophota bacterium]